MTLHLFPKLLRSLEIPVFFRKVEKILKSMQPRFDPITFDFSEKSNYGRESLLEMLRHRQQTYENISFFDITQQCFALSSQANFPAKNFDFH